MAKSMPEIIREAMRRDGRTRYRLAKDSGVDQAVLGRFIKGERDLNLRTADKVCKALGLKLVKERRRHGKGL
jgi:ribosome-binding protein aMBF1 (putative translation factor)